MAKGRRTEPLESTKNGEHVELLHESIYDHPRWYDMVFGADCAAEIKFIEGCARRYLDRPPKRLFEPACGTGRLLLRFAKRGYQVAGLDLNEKAIAFCNEKFVKQSLKPTAWVADMCDFKVSKPFDLAFNTINSFRHVNSEEGAIAHLRCMANAVRRGGLYLLGLHLTPTKGTPNDNEGWSVRRGHLSIRTWMWPVEKLPRKRLERFGIRFDIRTPTRHLRIDDELRLRSYTAPQMNDLFASAKSWKILGTYDFRYNLKKPVSVDERTEDVVFVLRREV
jgi:SAM-dependent methyltransferase